MKAAQIIVSGLVQGVGFRYFVIRKARALGLNGFVKNTYEGDVEIIVEGELGMINQLIEEVKVGPISSDVRDMKIDWSEPTGEFNGFDVIF
ncbi:acylphosphatase [candidate division WOR-3 bacterium]|nr:acylphosphatase [candidate division WOR-3 bacterium]MCK4576359.1 acylphosphatase [candidate division WOR-3 bacterium]